MFIRPTLDPLGPEGARLKVRDPLTFDHLAAEGEEKPDSEYWHRRVLDGGVEARGPDGAWPLPPADNTEKVGEAVAEARVEIKPDADGVATFDGDYPAPPAIRDEPPAEESRP